MTQEVSVCNPVTTSRPDALLEKGEHAGFEWEVTSNGIGYRCGYVRVPAGHPWHGKDYGDESLYDVEVHGGLTFAAADTDCGKGGEDNAWWLGFDCAHYLDAKDPRIMTGEQIAHELAMEARYPRLNIGQVVRTTEYVAAECRALAEQAARAAAG
jgi:hypothetical protein